MTEHIPILPDPTEVTEQSLYKLLDEHGLPVHTWGMGAAKTVAHLAQEIKDQESVLNVRPEDGRLIRRISVVGVEIRWADGDQEMRLKENRQIFHAEDGQPPRVRTRNLPTSLGEKMKPDEDVHEAALRAVQEELAVPGVESLHVYDEREEQRESGSYPGLLTVSRCVNVRATLATDHIRPEYWEVQDDKKTHFVWEPVPSQTPTALSEAVHNG